jgi:antitoxin PrlF
MATLTVTAKGQITLKQELLRHLKVAPGQKVEVEKLPDGRLIVGSKPKKGSISRFSGFLAKEGTPRFTIAQIKKFTEEAWAGKR